MAPGSSPVRRLWIPNALTGLRVLLVPVVIVLLPRVDPASGWLATDRLLVAALFSLLAVTDWIDGYLARRLEATSRWGSLADAVADRLALVLPLLYLALRPQPAFPAVPLWIPLWLVTLDVGAGSAWLVARWKVNRHPSFSHAMVGRVAVWCLFGLVLWILMGLPAAGVSLLAVAGLSLATASTVLHVRRWLAPGRDRGS